MGYMVCRDDGWRMPDWLWERIVPLLPAPPFHPLGTHRSRVSDRDAMDAILYEQTPVAFNAFHFIPVRSTIVVGASAFSGVGAGGCVRGDLAAGAFGVRPGCWDRLGVAGRRRCDDEGAVGWPEDRPEPD